MNRNLEQVLRQAVHDLADETRGPTALVQHAIARGRRLRRRRRAATGLVTVAALAAIAMPFVWLRPDPGSQFAGPAEPTAAEATPTPTTSPVVTKVGDNWREAPIQLPGGWIITGATSTGTPAQVAYVLDQANGRYAAIEKYEEVWAAPHGDLAAVRDDKRYGELGLLNVRTGKVQWIRTGQPILIPQWSPDGTRLLLTLMDKETAAFSFGVITAADGRFRSREVDMGRYLCTDWCHFTWQPDGQEVALAQTDPSAPRSESAPHLRRGVQLFSADNGRPTRLLPVKGNVAGPTAWSPDGLRVIIVGQQGPEVVEVETGRVVRDFPLKAAHVHQTTDAHWVSNDRILWLDAPGVAVLTDVEGNQLERLRLPEELAFLNLSVAPA